MADRRRLLVRRGARLAVASLVVAGTAAQVKADDDDRYRVASATVGDVEQLLVLNGTVSPASQQDATFAVSGSVATVDVEIGQEVTAGQRLATLELDPFDDAVLQAQADLDSALAQLEDAKTTDDAASRQATTAPAAVPDVASPADNGAPVATAPPPAAHTPTPSTTPTPNTTPSTSGTPPPASPGTVPTSLAPNDSPSPSPGVDVTHERTAVAAALVAAGAARTAAEQELASADASCQAAFADAESSQPQSEIEPTPTASADRPGHSAAPEQDGRSSIDTDLLAACLDALRSTSDKQAEVAAALAAVAAVSDDLIALLLTPVLPDGEPTRPTQPTEPIQPTGPPASPPAEPSGPSTTPTPAPTELVPTQTAEPTEPAPAPTKRPNEPREPREPGQPSSASQPSRPAPSATVAAASAGPGIDVLSASTGGPSAAGASQASRVASAEVSVLEAEDRLAQAEQDREDAMLVAPTAGTVVALPLAVGGDASTGNVTIVNGGAVDVTVDVPLAKLPQVQAGQEARVTPDGATEALPGTVAQVSLLPTSSGASTYPVTVRVAAPTAALASGATASVELVLSQVDDVVTVPNSAITNAGTVGSGFAVVLTEDRRTERRRVTIGAIGATHTEVIDGVDAGQEVVLADLAAALPDGSGTTTTGGFPAGGFPGGLPAGGFPAGGFPGGRTGPR